MLPAWTVPAGVTQLQGWWSWHHRALAVSQSTAGQERIQKGNGHKICNPPLSSALCPVVEVCCKLKRIPSEGRICASFSKQAEGFLQKDGIPLSRTDFLLQCCLVSRQEWTHLPPPTQRLSSLLLESYLLTENPSARLKYARKTPTYYPSSYAWAHCPTSISLCCLFHWSNSSEVCSEGFPGNIFPFLLPEPAIRIVPYELRRPGYPVSQW